MSYKDIILEKKDHIAKITLNRPEARNAWTPLMTEELLSALDDVDRDDEMRVLVTTGAGKGFASGGNIKQMPTEGEQDTDRDRKPWQVQQGLSRSSCVLIPKLQKLQKPTIAMVNGAAVGGGFDFALAHDLRVGSENAWFMNGFARLGLVPGYGGAWLYVRVMGLPKALEYLFTHDAIEAEEALRIGVLNRLVPAGELEKETMALARKIADGAPIGMRLTKLLAYEALDMDLETAMQMSAVFEAITLTTEDYKTAVTALREKRPPVFQGR